jgi:hypothetical protein
MERDASIGVREIPPRNPFVTNLSSSFAGKPFASAGPRSSWRYMVEAAARTLSAWTGCLPKLGDMAIPARFALAMRFFSDLSQIWETLLSPKDHCYQGFVTSLCMAKMRNFRNLVPNVYETA